MEPHRKESFLWGLVGGFSFLVLLQAYELATGRLVDWPVKLGAAVLVVVGATALTYVAARRRTTGNEQA